MGFSDNVRMLLLLTLGMLAGVQCSEGGDVAITKESIRIKLDEFRDTARSYVQMVKQTTVDMKVKAPVDFTPTEKEHIHVGITDAFLKGVHIYETITDFAEKTIHHLWEEISKHSNGAADGFESAPHRCASLSLYEKAQHNSNIQLNTNLAWIFFSNDLHCLSREFDHIFMGSSKLEAGDRLSIEEALEKISVLILKLVKIRESSIEFYRAALIIFPEVVPDFSEQQTQQTELTEQLLRTMLKRVLDRRHL